jgi:hypothetical protein
LNFASTAGPISPPVGRGPSEGRPTVEHDRSGNDEHGIAHRSKRVPPAIVLSPGATATVAPGHDREVDPSRRHGNAESKVDRRRRALPLADRAGDGGSLFGRQSGMNVWRQALEEPIARRVGRNSAVRHDLSSTLRWSK